MQKGQLMKAAVVREFGGPEKLRLAQVAAPGPGEGQVRIEVRAAGVNPVDAGNRADGSRAGLKVPVIPGYDDGQRTGYAGGKIVLTVASLQ